MALNRLEITTSGSCQGHIDHGAPAPWIKINSKNILSVIQVLKLKKHLSSLLKDFYKDRKVSIDIKLRIKSGQAGFWLYSGADFSEWRKIVDKRAKMIAAGKKIKRAVISQAEKNRRKKILPARQAEMGAFADFLGDKIK